MDRRKFFREGVKEVAREVMKTPVGSAIDKQLLAFSNLLSHSSTSSA
jgi:hypothetical protein